MKPHRYIMLNRSPDAEGIARPILVNTAHIVSVEDAGTFRVVKLMPDRAIYVSEHWDDFQGFLDSDAPY